jgi:hypothetical protein
MYILLFALGFVGMSLKYLIHANCSKRQYTSQFYSKWGFFKKSGRHRDQTTKTASRTLVKEPQTTNDIAATTTPLGRKTDGATQPQVSQFDFAPESCPTYPGLLLDSRADCSKEASSRQPRIHVISCLEERPQKPKAKSHRVSLSSGGHAIKSTRRERRS